MSMHKIPLMEIERSGLQNHGLAIGKPSQLSDVFRQGVRYALTMIAAESAPGTSPVQEESLEMLHIPAHSCTVA